MNLAALTVAAALLAAVALTVSVDSTQPAPAVDSYEQAHSYSTCTRSTHWHGSWRVRYIGNFITLGRVYYVHEHRWLGIGSRHDVSTNCGRAQAA